MKAIQVKFLSETSRLPSRLKVMAEGVPSITLSIYSIDTHSVKSVQQIAAEKMANHYGWLSFTRVLRGGVIPNGDHVFVIVELM